MMCGLLMELEDHNCWTVAEAAGHRGPHRLQHLLSRAVWDDQQVLDTAAAWAAAPATIRGYQTELRLFSEYLTDARYGWAAACEREFGPVVHPVPVCHEWTPSCT
jgi:hypothetical protein